MPVVVNRVEDKPIIIATFSGTVTVADVIQTFQQSAEIMGDDEQSYHRITDVRTANSNFIEMLGVIKEASTGQPGSTTDPRIKTTFVGTTTWIAFFRNALQNPQFGGKSMAAFENMDDALASIHVQLDNNQDLHAS